MAKYSKVESLKVVLRDLYTNLSYTNDIGGDLQGSASLSGGNLVCVAGGGVQYMAHRYDLWSNGFTVVLGLATTTSGDSTFRRFFAYRIDAEHTILLAMRRTDGSVIAQVGNGSGASYLGILNTLDLDVAQIITLTFDGTTLSLYKNDGLLASTSTLGGAIIAAPTTEFIFRVGEGPTASFAGNISFVTVLAGSVMDAEVSDLVDAVTFSEVDDAQTLVSLPLRSHYDDSGTEVTENIGNLGGTVTLGDGSTTATFPTQLTPHGMSFDGSNDYISLSTSTVDISSDFSVSALLIKDMAGTDNDRVFSFVDDANNDFQLVTDDGSGKWAARLQRAGVETINDLTYGDVESGVLIHIVYVVSGSAGAFFKNGEIVATDGATNVVSGGTNFYDIGRRDDGTGSGFFTGTMFFLRIFDFALTATQIRELSRRDYKLINN